MEQKERISKNQVKGVEVMKNILVLEHSEIDLNNTLREINIIVKPLFKSQEVFHIEERKSRILSKRATWAPICQAKDNGRVRKREGQGLVRKSGHLAIVEACER